MNEDDCTCDHEHEISAIWDSLGEIYNHINEHQGQLELIRAKLFDQTENEPEETPDLSQIKTVDLIKYLISDRQIDKRMYAQIYDNHIADGVREYNERQIQRYPWRAR